MCTAGLHALQQPCSQTPPSLASHQVWAHQSQLEEQLTTRAQHCNALPWRQHVKSPASNSSSAHLPTLCLNHIKLASTLVQVLLPPHLCRSAYAQPLQPTDPHPTPHADSKQEERNTADDWCGNHPCRHGGLCKRVLGSKSEALEQTHQHLRFPGDHSAEY